MLSLACILNWQDKERVNNLQNIYTFHCLSLSPSETKWLLLSKSKGRSHPCACSQTSFHQGFWYLEMSGLDSDKPSSGLLLLLLLCCWVPLDRCVVSLLSPWSFHAERCWSVLSFSLLSRPVMKVTPSQQSALSKRVCATSFHPEAPAAARLARYKMWEGARTWYSQSSAAQ